MLGDRNIALGPIMWVVTIIRAGEDRELCLK
jgi:hypothetical protein